MSNLTLCVVGYEMEGSTQPATLGFTKSKLDNPSLYVQGYSTEP